MKLIVPKIAHFEIPTDEPERAKKFYTNLFEWEFEKWQGPIGILVNYYQKRQGRCGVAGGIMKKQNPQQPITNYIDVPSIDEYADTVNKLGGKVVVPKMAVTVQDTWHYILIRKIALLEYGKRI